MNDPEEVHGLSNLSRTKRQMVLHAGLVVLIDAAALLILAGILPGLTMDGAGAALGTALVIGVLNALVWPVLSRFTLRISVMTLGLFGLVLNTITIAAVIYALPWIHEDSFAEAVLLILVLSAVTALASSLLAINEDGTWYLNVVQRQLRLRDEVKETDIPGVVFLEIDGLAHDVLRRAISNGNAPTIANWVREDTYNLEVWETDWSSQTGACQAGILHGSNEDMPAFRWWEKDKNKAIVTNHPRDAAEIERRHSDGKGLLANDGASRANILSGDAPHSMLTMSTVLKRRGKIGHDYAAYFARPFGIIKTALYTLIEIFRERHYARKQVRDDVIPRINRPRSYAIMRAWATVIQLDLQIAAVIGDMLAGRPVIYTTFLAYDEVAHHSGIERPDTMAVLRKVDEQIKRVVSVADLAPRPYRFIVLSDHGQSQGMTFLDRYGVTLEDVVSGASSGGKLGVATEGEDDARAYLNATITETANEDSATGKVAKRLSKNDGDGFGPDGSGRDEDDADDEVSDDEIPDLSVMASGNLGLITFPREPGRVTVEQLDEIHPDLLDTLTHHPGIGFALMRSEEHGAIAFGAKGTNFLDRSRIEGEDPLAPFGPNAADHVRRTDRFEHCPDIVLNSTYWDELDEVAAFEELVGSHGGLGGTQSYPFVLHPAEFEWPADGVVGAEDVHYLFMDWLAKLGQTGEDSVSSEKVQTPN